ncbi:MAG: low affinity iron permease family protein [Candidatus Dadabacteria bacterium]
MSNNNRLQKSLDNQIKAGFNSGKTINGFSRTFQNMAAKVTKATGSSIAFILALSVIIIWGITGPFFHYSDTWQLVINTSTTIVTFLMVFIIQQTQNKDSLAVQLKLNELIAANEKASNRLIVVEDLTQEELETLKNFYVKLAELAGKESDLHKSHSVEEAAELHATKLSLRSGTFEKKKV